MAERWYARLSRILRHEMKDRQPVILYAEPCPLPADQHHRRRARRGHGRRHRGLQAAHRAARRRLAGGDRPRARPRARARVPIRDDRAGQDVRHELAGRAPHAALVHRGDGGVPLGGAGRLAHGHVDARRGAARRAADHPRPRRQREVFPLPLRPGALGLHRRPLRRPDRPDACCAASGRAATTRRRSSRRVLHVEPPELSKEWHAALRDAATPRRRGQEGRDAYGPATGHARRSRAAASTWRPC